MRDEGERQREDKDVASNTEKFEVINRKRDIFLFNLNIFKDVLFFSNYLQLNSLNFLEYPYDLANSHLEINHTLKPYTCIKSEFNFGLLRLSIEYDELVCFGVESLLVGSLFIFV